MKVHNINLNIFQKHGKVELNTEKEGVEISSLLTVNNHFERFAEPITHYVFIPEKYKLPMKIDLTVKVDSPMFYVLLGKGHIGFNSSWNDNRRISDIAEPSIKPINFDNAMPINTDVDISILYGTNFMQIMINGEERYYTEKSAYMKKKLIADMNENGLELRLMCSKRTRLLVKNVTVTEYGMEEEYVKAHGLCNLPLLGIDKTEKSDLEGCISHLSKDLQEKITEVDRYLLGHKKLGIKRKVEGTHKASRITYLSKEGFSYMLIITQNIMYHYFWWYIVSNYKYENKYGGRKNDLTTQTLQRIQEKNPELAKNLFDLYISCCGCYPGCAARTLYEFDGVKQITCHGKMLFKMAIEDFDYVIEMMEAIEEII